MDTALPETFAAGTSVEYEISHSDYPADAGWSLVLHLSGASRITPLAGTPNGKAFDFALTAAMTAPLDAGTYQYVERATKGAIIKDVRTGGVVVTPDIAQAPAGTLVSMEEQWLPMIETAITTMVQNPLRSYQIGARAFTRTDLDELYALRAKFKAALAQKSLGDSPFREVKVTLQ